MQRELRGCEDRGEQGSGRKGGGRPSSSWQLRPRPGGGRLPVIPRGGRGAGEAPAQKGCRRAAPSHAGSSAPTRPCGRRRPPLARLALPPVSSGPPPLSGSLPGSPASPSPPGQPAPLAPGLGGGWGCAPDRQTRGPTDRHQLQEKPVIMVTPAKAWTTWRCPLLVGVSGQTPTFYTMTLGTSPPVRSVLTGRGAGRGGGWEGGGLAVPGTPLLATSSLLSGPRSAKWMDKIGGLGNF